MITDSTPIIVTGATGWVGRTALEYLSHLLPTDAFKDRVFAFGSKRSKIPVARDSCRSISVRPLDELSSISQDSFVFHAAFATRDRLSHMGSENYIATNQRITGLLCAFLQRNPRSKVVIISSGAASLYPDYVDACSSVNVDPYGSLKRIEELTLSSLCESSVFRIYALSGFYIRTPHLLALGSFLESTKNSSPIHIRSQAKVVRGYVHALNLCQAAFNWLLAPSPHPLGYVNAISHVVDLVQLANIVTNIFSLPPVISHVDHSLPIQNYSASPGQFIKYMSSCQLPVTTLEHQILDTALGLGISNIPSL